MQINGNLIKEYREDNLISLEEMAVILGIDSEILEGYENGDPWYEEDALTLYIIDSIFLDLDYIDYIEDEANDFYYNLDYYY